MTKERQASGNAERRPVSAKIIDRLAEIARRSVKIEIKDPSTDDGRVHFILTGPSASTGVAGVKKEFDLGRESFDRFADRALIHGKLAHQRLEELAPTASALSRQQLTGSLVALALSFPQRVENRKHGSRPVRQLVGRVVTNEQADAILSAFHAEETAEPTTSNDPGPHKTYRRAV